MIEFRKYTPSSWVQEGLVTRAVPEPPPAARTESLKVVAAIATIVLSTLGVGVADHGPWQAAAWEHFRESQPPPSAAGPPVAASVVAEFDALASQWEGACRFLSSTTRRTSHPSFRRIVSMGDSVIPLLLARLEQPGDWDIALGEIVGQEAIPAEGRVNRASTTRMWREWARENGWLDDYKRRA